MICEANQIMEQSEKSWTSGQFMAFAKSLLASHELLIA